MGLHNIMASSRARKKDRGARGGRGRPQAKYSPGGRQATPWDNDPYVLSGLSEEAMEQRRMKALLKARRQTNLSPRGAGVVVRP